MPTPHTIPQDSTFGWSSPKDWTHEDPGDRALARKRHITDIDFGRLLEQGISIRAIAGWLGLRSVATLYKRLRDCRLLYGEQFGGSTSAEPPSVEDEIAELLATPAPNREQLLHLCYHAISLGLTRATMTTIALANTAAKIARDIEAGDLCKPTDAIESEGERKQRLLEVVVRALPTIPPR